MARIAFDVHGTLDRDADGMLMKILDKCLEKRDKVFIISGPPTHQIEEEVTALGINVLDVTIVSVVDWLKDQGIYMWQDDRGTWWCDDQEWWTSKGKICAEYKIDMMFDDMIGYLVAMPPTTRFVHCVINKDTKEFEMTYYGSGGASSTTLEEI